MKQSTNEPKTKRQASPPKKKRNKKGGQRSLSKTVHIVDTNVLYLWLSHAPGAPVPDWAKENPDAWKRVEERQKRAAAFCTNPRHLILVPGLVWVELYGVFLQKDIDLDHYAHWHQQRRSALQQLEAHFFDPLSHIQLGAEIRDSEMAVDICRHPASDKLRDDLRKAYEGRTTPDGRPRSVKCLDGVDGAIVSYAWKYAVKHPDLIVRLLTDDRGCHHMIRELRRCKQVQGHLSPLNLGYQNIYGIRWPLDEKLLVRAPDNPLEREARSLFRAGDYAGAARRWEQRAEQSAHRESPAKVMMHVAHAYLAWGQMDYRRASGCLDQALTDLAILDEASEDHSHCLDQHTVCLLSQQRDIFGQIADYPDTQRPLFGIEDATTEASKRIVFAFIRELWGRFSLLEQKSLYNEAALLLYRLLELLCQWRLLRLGLSPTAPDYSQCEQTEASMLEAYNHIIASDFGGEEVSALPSPIAMLNGCVLLRVRQDPFLEGISLQKIRGIMRTRNQTVFAHGFHSVTPKEAVRMKQLLEECLEQFWKLEGVPLRDVIRMQDVHTPVSLAEGQQAQR